MPKPSPDPISDSTTTPWEPYYGPADFRADLGTCRALLRRGSRSFHAASLLLPRRVREPTSALYAFCRLADDLVDGGPVNGGGCAAGAALDGLRDRLARAYAGTPLPRPVDRAFAEVVARHGIPRALPEALLEGLAWDVEGRRYENLSALRAYAVRVAGTVGAMMALLMGVPRGARGEAALARAADLGVAMQLTNIARDVGEDARAGRLYLPLDWMRDAGLNPDAWLARPVHDARLASVVRRLLAEAAPLYARGLAGLAELPADCRPAIAAAGAIYGEIGAEVARRGWDSVGARAVVPARRKLVLLAKAMAAIHGRPALPLAVPPLPEALFLVAAAEGVTGPRADAATPWWAWRTRGLWLFHLFTELEQRERLRRGPPLRTVRLPAAGGAA